MKLRQRVFRWVGGVGLCVVLGGCLTYESEFQCSGDPKAGRCASVPDIYHSGSASEPVVDERGGLSSPERVDWVIADGDTERVLGKPIVNPPVVFIGWIAPWKSEEGKRVFEGSIVYLMVEAPAFSYGHRVAGKGVSKEKVIVPTVFTEGAKPGRTQTRRRKAEQPRDYVDRALKQIKQMDSQGRKRGIPVVPKGSNPSSSTAP